MVIKTHVYETVCIETQSNYSEFLMKKNTGGNKISNPHFARTNPKIAENKTVYTCHTVFIPGQNSPGI